MKAEGILYDIATQEIVDATGSTYPKYLISYDSETGKYYATSQEEVRYLDVYAVLKEGDEPKPVYATIKREDYIGNDDEELYGGTASTKSWEDEAYAGNAFTTEWREIIDPNYGKLIIKPVQVYEENLNTEIDYVNYLIYEEGTMNLQENIMFTLSWKPENKFIILNGQVHHVASIDYPWVYNPDLNETPLQKTKIVLPYITSEDVMDQKNRPYIRFFDEENESIEAWKTKEISLWQANTQYIVGDTFIYDGIYYKVVTNYTSTGVFKDDNLQKMSDLEIATYTTPSYFPCMNLLFAKPNTNLYAYKILNQEENKGKFFTGRKMCFFEVHFSPVYNKDIDNFSVSFYDYNQTKSPEFQLI
jgi:hypothetical protein